MLPTAFVSVIASKMRHKYRLALQYSAIRDLRIGFRITDFLDIALGKFHRRTISHIPWTIAPAHVFIAFGCALLMQQEICTTIARSTLKMVSNLPLTWCFSEYVIL